MTSEEKLDFAFFSVDDLLNDSEPPIEETPPSGQPSTSSVATTAFEEKEPHSRESQTNEMSVAEQLTESEVLKDLLSGHLSEATRLQCVKVLGCEPINLMREDIKQGLIAKCPQLRAEFGEEDGLMFNFYSGINLGSMKFYNSIMEAAIARTCLDNLISTMNTGTMGREEVAEFANELQLLFIQFAEKTQTFVLGMAKTTGVLAQASTALDYGADASCLLQVVSKVIGEVSKEIQSVEESRQLTSDKILHAQHFLRTCMRGNTSEYEQLEMSVARHEQSWNDAIVKRRAFREKLFKERMDASAAKTLAESRIISIEKGIQFCHEAKQRALARKHNLELALERYDGMHRDLVAQKYKHKPYPNPPNYEQVMNQLLERSGVETNFGTVRAKMEAKAEQQRNALLKRYDDMGKAEAEDLIDLDEMKKELSEGMSQQITERKEAIQKNINDVEREIRELLKLEEEAMKPPPAENEEASGGWWAHRKQHQTQDQMIQDIADQETFLKSAIASLNDERAGLHAERVQMEKEAASASDGRTRQAVSSSTRTKKSWWWGRRKTYTSTTYAMVQTGPNVQEGLRQAASSIQDDINAINREIERVEAELQNVAEKKQAAYARKQQIDAMTEQQNNSRLQKLRSDRQAKQQQKRDLEGELSKVTGDVQASLNSAHQELLKEAAERNKESREEARLANERQEKERNNAFNALMDQQTKSMNAVLEQITAREVQVREQIRRTIETLKDVYAQTVNQIRQFNADRQAAFDSHKEKALRQVQLQQKALTKGANSCEVECAKIDVQVENRMSQQDDQRRALTEAEERLDELEKQEGTWVRMMKTLTEREATAKKNYGAAVVKFEDFQKKFDMTNKTQFANMRRALELLAVSTNNLPMALTFMNGVFQQTETALGGETFAETMAFIPDKKAFLKDFTKAMQLICRIGWAMFDRPIQSMMRVESAHVLASLRVEAPPSSAGPVIEEVKDDEFGPRMIAME